MNKEVTFPIAKLLKEKGFNLKVIIFYDYERLSTPFDKQRQVDGLINYNPINWNSVKEHYTSAPTIADVVMWLYDKHGIWVQVCISRYGKFYCNILKKENTKSLDNPISWEMQSQLNDFNSPTEAYEAAIEYTLNNLI